MTVATVLEIGQTDKSAFDLLLAEIEKDVSGGPKPKLVTIDGRRAVLNREEDKGYTAQNGLIDLGGGKVIILLVGIEPGSKAGPMERAEMIDRFTYSIKVAGQ